MQYFFKGVGRVICVTHFGPTCLTCVMHLRCEGPELSLFWTASEWVTERGICDEPRVRMRFQYHNLVVLYCIIIGRAIGEQWGYAARILFELIAHHKSMLCWPLLCGFTTYPFL
jgi:hypothetical protein